MKKRQTSYAFLMEMMWVCGFFALASCIFVLTFVKADHLSKSAENLNHAVLAAQNAVESCFSEYGEAGGDDAQNTAQNGAQNAGGEIYFDRSWAPVASAGQAVFTLTVSTREEGGLLLVTAVVSGSNKETIYQLDGTRSLALMEGGRYEKQN